MSAQSGDDPGGSNVGESARGQLSVLMLVEQLRRAVPGGIGTYTRGLINGLLQLGRTDRPSITLLASKSTEQPDPLRSFALPIVTSRFSTVVTTQLWEHNITRLHRTEQVVHSVGFGAPSSSAPLVMTIHDLAWRAVPQAFPPRGRRWHEAALRHAADRATHFVVPSTSVRDALCESASGISQDRITVIEEGADHLPKPDEIGTQHILRQLGVRGEFLLATGTLEPRKNLLRLIRAYEQIRPRLPEPWPLVIVGPTGWGNSSKGGKKGVVFAGHVAPAVLSGLYRSARAVAYVPLIEGFGLPVVEAMSAGTPVVSSDVPSAGGASQLVDPTDVDAIASGLFTALTDDARRSELARLGTQRVAPLTWRAVGEAHVLMWRDVVSRVQ